MALLNDVLDISKIEAGKIEIARIDGDLRLTLERVRQLFLSRAVERGLSVNVEIAADLPPLLRYDPVRVRQCVSNLLSNAIKFTETRQRDDQAVGVEAARMPATGWCSIAVSDTGIGMDEDTVSRLFAPSRRPTPRSRAASAARALALRSRASSRA